MECGMVSFSLPLLSLLTLLFPFIPLFPLPLLPSPPFLLLPPFLPSLPFFLNFSLPQPSCTPVTDAFLEESFPSSYHAWQCRKVQPKLANEILTGASGHELLAIHRMPTNCNVSSFVMTTCLSGRHMWPVMHHKTTATTYNVYVAT